MWSSFKSTQNTLQFLCLFNTCPEAMVEKIDGDYCWIIFFEEPRMLGFILCHGKCILFWWQHLTCLWGGGEPYRSLYISSLYWPSQKCSIDLCSFHSGLQRILFGLSSLVVQSLSHVWFFATQGLSTPVIPFKVLAYLLDLVIAIKELPVRWCCQ